jgi:8-oxo-dGTP pyrophosphatase MutT (NUDIX family)
MAEKLYFAQKAFIEVAGNLLLVRKSADDPHNPGRWELPGGRICVGEDIDEHLRREVYEEVGLQVDPGTPFHVWQWSWRNALDGGISQVVAIARLCRAVSTAVSLDNQVDGDFIGGARWTPVAEVLGLELIPSQRPAVEAYLAMRAGRVRRALGALLPRTQRWSPPTDSRKSTSADSIPGATVPTSADG